MQAVVVSRFVLQEERRRPGLPGAMAATEKSRMIVRIADLDPHDLIPAVRDERKLRVEHGAQPRDDLGKGIGKILVLAAAEAVARHHDPAAKSVLRRIDRRKRFAFRRRKYRRRD